MTRIRLWLRPIVHLSNNLLSRLGVIIVTAAGVFWIWLLPTTLRGEADNPYTGILAFLILPAAFFAGLAIIPIGIGLRLRKERSKGLYPTDFPPLDLKNVDLRRLLTFIGVATVANVIIGSQVTYRALSYMDTETFCGETCHTVMEPEFTAYQNSPHSRVECTECHIGAGASWFVRSKLSGIGQVFAVALNTYPRPIPTPVHNLRPARETCEACHWPQKYGADRLRVLSRFSEDEANTHTKTVLLMRIGGGGRGPGIHGAHLNPGIVIRYAHSDERREQIAWVEKSDGAGNVTLYSAPGAKTDDTGLSTRVMDCIDCHNRPTHTFELPERSIDRVLAADPGLAALPFFKSKGAEIIKGDFASRDTGNTQIPAQLEQYYRDNHPSAYAQHRDEIARGGRALVAVYDRNVFPDMNVAWGTYTNNIGHTDFPGCFRCHDDEHTSADGASISQDCNTCHQLLAMEEEAPEILNELGISDD